MADQPIAVIDVGSNSARVSVLALDAGDHIQVLAGARVALGLAKDAHRDGTLDDAAIGRVVSAVRNLAAIADRAGSVRTIAVATAAVRDASNGDKVVERVLAETGIAIEIIDGEAEARASFHGAIQSLPVDGGLLLDVGGGSIELAPFTKRAHSRAISLPLGSLRLTLTHLTGDPPSDDEMARMTSAIDDDLRRLKLSSLKRSEALVGTGGTLRTLAKIDQRESDHPFRRVHGHVLSRARVDVLLDVLGSRALRKRRKLAGLKRDRAESVVAGTAVIQRVMELVGAPAITVSGQGLREGLALGALGAHVPDPAALRRDSIAALSARFSTWSELAATRRASIALTILDAVEPGAADREFLEHAAHVLDVGASVELYGAARHAAVIVAGADLAGFSHVGVAKLALMLRAITGDDYSGTARRLLTDDDLAFVARAGTILALACDVERRLDRHTDGSAVRCTVNHRDMLVRASVPCGTWIDAAVKRFRRDLGIRLGVEGCP